jgi:hypothetical protein
VFILPMPVLAIFSAALAYWLLGALWYSQIFGRVWAADLQSRGLRIPRPPGSQLVIKLLLTFLATFLVATAVAWVLQCFSVSSPAVATRLAMVLGIGVAAATTGIGSVWQGKPLRVYLMDAGYHIIGIWLCAMVLLEWRR